MSGRSFLDTNVLIYTDDHDAPEKQRRAIEVYERVRRSRTGVISTQVLQEYFVAATRKLGGGRRRAAQGQAVRAPRRGADRPRGHPRRDRLPTPAPGLVLGRADRS